MPPMTRKGRIPRALRPDNSIVLESPCDYHLDSRQPTAFRLFSEFVA
jgi:hypothetical protein